MSFYGHNLGALAATPSVGALGVGARSYRAALLALSPTYAWLAGDISAPGAAASWPCAVTGLAATQATPANQPAWSATGLSGKPALTFDGGDWLRTAAFAAALAQPYSVVILGSDGSGTSTRVMFDGIAAAHRASMLAEPLTSIQRFQLYSGGADRAVYTLSPFPAVGVVFSARARINGTSTALAINGVEQETPGAGVHTLTGVTIGANATPALGWNGAIADILVFSGADYAARAAAADTLARAHYGI